tara:strand:- start:951 stop:1952 length:1002 start_codon:yes stop_codon:yes gene_type:complete
MTHKIYYYYSDEELDKIKNGQYNNIYYGKDILKFLMYDYDADYALSSYNFSFNYKSSVMTYLTSVNLDILCDKLGYAELFKYKSYCPLTITKNNVWYYKIFSNKIKDKQFYIKPVLGSCGYNINIVNNPISLINNNKLIAQESIPTNLLNERKWDIRIYIVHQIINNKFYTYLYKDGVIRLAPEKYKFDNNLRTLLTNTSLLKNTDTHEDLNMPFSEHPDHNLYFDKILKAVSDIHHHIKNNLFFAKSFYFSEFQLLGYDFIISKDHKPYLLEINYSPHSILAKNSKSVSELKSKMFKNIYEKFIKAPILHKKKYNKIDNNFYIMDDNFININ